MAQSNNPEFASPLRENIFRVLVFLVAIGYTARLGYLQIIKGGEFLEKSETQAIKQKTKQPYRGCMFDRNGKMILQNSASFCITITPNDFDTTCIPFLSQITSIEQSTIRSLYKQYRKQRFSEIKILRDAPPNVVAAVEEFHSLLPGVDIAVETKRVYDFKGNGSHLFGYCSMIDENDLKNLGDYYQPNDIIGKTGLEKSYEDFLHGNKGAQFIAVNAAGQPIESFNNGKSDIDATEGTDLYLGIDTKLQEIAERELGDEHGAVVVLDPRNGEVMTLVSKPDFDLRLMTGSNFSEEYQKLVFNEDKPLFNRAMQTQYPPGSTWKMLMTLAGLQEGVITPESKNVCGGGYFYGGRLFKCHGGSHGAINAERAIHVSCNTFFYKLAQMIGIDTYQNMVRCLGLDNKLVLMYKVKSRITC